jgi:hypothetical protein
MRGPGTGDLVEGGVNEWRNGEKETQNQNQEQKESKPENCFHV